MHQYGVLHSDQSTRLQWSFSWCQKLRYVICSLLGMTGAWNILQHLYDQFKIMSAWTHLVSEFSMKYMHNHTIFAGTLSAALPPICSLSRVYIFIQIITDLIQIFSLLILGLSFHIQKCLNFDLPPITF